MASRMGIHFSDVISNVSVMLGAISDTIGNALVMLKVIPDAISNALGMVDSPKVFIVRREFPYKKYPSVL